MGSGWRRQTGGGGRVGLRLVSGRESSNPTQAGGIEVEMEDGEWSPEGDTGAGLALALAPTSQNGYYSFCREGNGREGGRNCSNDSTNTV